MKCTCGREVKDHPAGDCLNALFHKLVMEKKVFIPEKWKSWSKMQMTEDEFGKIILIPKYSSNIAHAMRGEEEVLKSGKEAWGKYILHLIYVVEHDHGDWQDLGWWLHRENPEAIFPLVHATAHQRTRALILWAQRKGE